MQAQNDLMALLARKEISIVSTEDSIEIIAKKRVTINGGEVISRSMPVALNQRRQVSTEQGPGITSGGKKAQHKPDIAPLANAINDGSHNIRYLVYR
ncbi:DUF2345 domain-containing protein [Klebsiella pneumoniae subsp. pneumoniae]|nr:DUF2345 domain-containing protein [Klebsiella pneumoniae subsp. pneumoniae]